MSNRYWHIKEYEGTTEIFDIKVKVGCFTEKQIQSLLMALTAKAGLNFDEIVGAYAKKKTKYQTIYCQSKKMGLIQSICVAIIYTSLHELSPND